MCSYVSFYVLFGFYFCVCMQGVLLLKWHGFGLRAMENSESLTQFDPSSIAEVKNENHPQILEGGLEETNQTKKQ